MNGVIMELPTTLRERNGSKGHRTRMNIGQQSLGGQRPAGTSPEGGHTTCHCSKRTVCCVQESNTLIIGATKGSGRIWTL